MNADMEALARQLRHPRERTFSSLRFKLGPAREIEASRRGEDRRDGPDERGVISGELLEPPEKSLRRIHLHGQHVIEAGTLDAPKRAQRLASLQPAVAARGNDRV